VILFSYRLPPLFHNQSRLFFRAPSFRETPPAPGSAFFAVFFLSPFVMSRSPPSVPIPPSPPTCTGCLVTPLLLLLTLRFYCSKDHFPRSSPFPLSFYRRLVLSFACIWTDAIYFGFSLVRTTFYEFFSFSWSFAVFFLLTRDVVLLSLFVAGRRVCSLTYRDL